MKIAIVIPIHPKHYKYIYSLHSSVVDIYLIFSNEHDYSVFESKDRFKHIIIPPNTNTGNIVTFKKWYALKTLKTQYEYYIVCDSEIQIIPENFTLDRLTSKITHFFEQKTIFAGYSDTEWSRKITSMSSNTFVSSEDKQRLQHITKEYRMYYWWSDIPIYRSSDLNDFFDKINMSNICWFQFDHIVYIDYLLLYHNFTIENITDYTGIPWSLEYPITLDHFQALKTHGYSLAWIMANSPLYKKHREECIKNGCFIVYHTDRIEEK